MASVKGRAGVAAVILILAVAVIAVLVSYPHQIEVSSEGNGTVVPTGDNEVRFYQGLDLDIQPDDGYASEVYVDGVLKAEGVSGFRYSPFVLDFSPHTIKVVFVKYVPVVPQHILTVTSEGNGTVSPSGTASYDDGSVVKVISVADDGNVIDDVILDGVSMGPSNIFEVTMGSDHSVKVVFRPVGSGDIPVTVSVDVDVDIVIQTLGASQDLDYGYTVPSGTVYVEPHGSLTISVVLNPGFEIRSLSIDGRSVGAVTEYTIEDITSSVSIQLSIVKEVNGFLIKASSGSGGSISPSGDVKVAEGDDSTFTFSPSSGYKVSYIVVDGVRTEYSGSSYTFSRVSSSHTIEVAFTASGGGGSGGGSSGGGGGTGTVTLTSISVTTQPDKMDYVVGESFDSAGMVITAYYSNGDSSLLSESQYTVVVDDPLTASSTNVTISFQDKSTVLVIRISVPVQLESISVNTPPKISYGLNDSFDPTGMDILATYSDGTTEVITEGFIAEDRTFDS
ncbi:MAG: bacterial Ig-like domain-containing protein, partial [Candidatus Methanomethylophilaceae archaeon]|nr:bacterial Ig-like domain-containing protein [Candidatus Methanomethylophilaceae archaeon]